MHYISEIRQSIDSTQLAWSLAFALLMVVTCIATGQFVEIYYPDPVRPDDLILDIIPEIRFFIGFGELISLVQGTLTVYCLGRRQFREAPIFLFRISVMFILRAFAITLTPLAQIQVPAQTFGDNHLMARYMYKGMFFSGHAGSAFTQYYFFAQREDNWLKRAHLTLAWLQVASLMAGHSHYTIDIFAAFFVAYFVTHHDFGQWVPHAWRHWHWAPWAAREMRQVRQRTVTAAHRQSYQRGPDPNCPACRRADGGRSPVFLAQSGIWTGNPGCR